MNLETCFLCKRPVLELEGQFEKLDTYLLDETDTAYAQGAFGWCHARCLSASTWGKFWAERRIQHLTGVLGYSMISEDNAQTALRHPHTGDMITVRADGVTFAISTSALTQKRDTRGGVLLAVSEEMNLEFDDPDLAQEIRDRLVRLGQYPLPKVVAALDLSDCLLCPEAISGGALHFDKHLQGDWIDDWVSAIAEYDRFLPEAVLAGLRLNAT